MVAQGKNFYIEWGVRQGRPLTMYLFIIVGEVLTQTIMKACAKGRLKGVTLSGDNKQQIVSQYVDDSFFMMRGISNMSMSWLDC